MLGLGNQDIIRDQNTLGRLMKHLIGGIVTKILWRFRSFAKANELSRSGSRRIIYALTPPPSLSNVGDHAQVVAIMQWFAKHYPGYDIIEFDKNEVIHMQRMLMRKIRKSDIIYLHSGGNLGDRGIWSETARRLMINNFHENKIISLPQTIFFSDTLVGRRELISTRRIYNEHPDLTVIARDTKSFELAQEYFPNAKTGVAPDFVLSYEAPLEIEANKTSNGRCLLCLRQDDESNLSQADRATLEGIIERECDIYDTTLDVPIDKDRRELVLMDTLRMFSQYDAIVTDRFHGLIFSVLCRKPTVVLRTVDHKLTSAFDWFNDIKFVRLASSISEVPSLLSEVQSESDRSIPDWNELYFDKIVRCAQ